MITGTLYTTVKLQTLTNKWMQKKDSGNVLSKQEQEKRANWSADERMIHDYQQQMLDNREKSKERELVNKITAGETLTREEEQYLEQKDPAALKRYRDSKAEKKSYEEKLKNCKTRDEVKRIKTETVNGYLTSIKKIENDPYIPISAKLEKAQEILAKTRNINQAEMKFMQSMAYKNLPTEADEAIEASEKREAENAQLEAELKENNTETTQDTQDTEDNSDTESTETKIKNAYNRIKLNYDLDEITGAMDGQLSIEISSRQ